MGCNDIAMSEFWSRQSQVEPVPYIHQLAEAQLRYHDGIKNAASAAHIYGRKIAQANVAYKPDVPLLESGLLGPVTLQAD